MFDWEQILDNPPEWLENALEDDAADSDVEVGSEPSLGFI